MSSLSDRDRMVDEQLVPRGIRDVRILDAFRNVPRHAFVPEAQETRAYEDRPLPIGLDQTISQPYMTAWMTDLLEVHKGDRILEIGTGSGYQAAILAELGARVTTIERHTEISARAQRLLHELGYRGVHFEVDDGTCGYPDRAPFDGILVTAGGPSVPPSLVEQLAEGGRLVMPVGGSERQELLRLRKTAHGIERENHGRCSFVPLIGRHGWPPPAQD